MNYVNKEYWNNFYKEQKNLSDPSTFSKYILENIDLSNSILIDVGCGTGKDIFYFAIHQIFSIGIDGSKEAIKINIENFNEDYKKHIFYCVDLSNREKTIQVFSEINELAVKNKKDIVIYNRFFLHSITEEIEDLLLDVMLNTIQVSCKVISEFRTKEDEVLDKIYGDHYRRYVDTNKLLSKFLELNYELIFFDKKQGFSPYKEENPFLARMILEKNIEGNEYSEKQNN